jgi:hypothetical protein
LDPEKSAELRSALADAQGDVEFLREQLAAYADLDELVKAHASRFAFEAPLDAAPAEPAASKPAAKTAKAAK